MNRSPHRLLLASALLLLPVARAAPGRPDLAGTWYDYSPHTGNKGSVSTILQNGDRLTFINEFNDRSEGYFIDDRTIIATAWQGGLKASLENGNRRIVFANGSVWERSRRGTAIAARPDLSGAWFDYSPHTGNKGGASTILQNGDKLTFINEFNDRSEGHFIDNQTIIATAWQGGLRASLQNDNSRIVFANGSVWERSRRGAPPLPPGAPVDLNGSWSGGLLHIWQDGAVVLVTAAWKRDDGKYVSFRGDGRLSGRVADLSVRYSPMTHGPVAAWKASYTVSADGNTIEAVYTQGATTDRRTYVRDR